MDAQAVERVLSFVLTVLEEGWYSDQVVGELVSGSYLGMFLLTAVFGPFAPAVELKAVKAVWQLWHRYGVNVDTQNNLGLRYQYNLHTAAGQFYVQHFK